MLVYALQIVPRLTYIIDFIGKEIFDPVVRITTDLQEYDNHDGPKINYSTAKVSENDFWIYDLGLLFESNIRTRTIKCFEYNVNKAFFETKAGDFPFDIFAATFYLLSRYEEYLAHTKDKFGRYAHTNSIAYQESFLHLPLINIWLNDFKKSLLKKYPALQFRKRFFTYHPTYDIDIAWSYRNKGFLRNTGGLLKSVLAMNWNALKERFEVLLKRQNDPFDSYEWLHAIHKITRLKPLYFFLIAFKQKGFDKNISPFNNDLQQLIKEHDQIYSIGIHPSWQSGDDEVLLEDEIKQLAKIVGHDIIHSRQHYLRFTLPATYQRLIKHGIKNDFSMGYGMANGFRASVASSYYWYDLENETATDLLIHPFCFMDANAYYEMKLSPAQALEKLMNFYTSIKAIDGTMITLWHNNFLGTDRNFAGWREAYERFLKNITGTI